MAKRVMLTFLLCSFLFTLSVWAQTERAEVEFEIPYNLHVLENGLTLIHHQDTKAPIVAVNVWYHVGSKNEKPGKTGFAHLFEHLMFNGSENYNDDYFKVLSPLGATTLNGTTSWDRTNYFQNVPKSAIDVVLWMESDRMGHLLGAIDQAKLDEQREVVKNEKRQGDNQPYGKVIYSVLENVFPEGHPYSWSVIGSMDDLNAASVEDVHQWFKSYYGPNNAVLVVAGDIDFETAKTKVEKYFGDIPPGPPVTRLESWVPKHTTTRRAVMQDRAPLPQLWMVWPLPAWGTVEADRLSLVSEILSSGKSSRLYKRLVYDDQIALDVTALAYPLEISGIFGIIATPKPGVSLDQIEGVIQEELDRMLAEGPTEKELNRVRTQQLSSFLRGAETIGGFGGKSDILATNMVYGGTPDFYKNTLANIKAATVKNLTQAAQDWLSEGAFILHVEPFDQLSSKEEGADRSKLPTPGEPPAATFPNISSAQLSNGMKVFVVERSAVPVVQFRLVLNAGYAADSLAKEGTAKFTLSMIDEGTESLSALEISDQLQLLGMTLGSYSNLDQSVVSMSSLKMNLEESLALFADAVMNPSFPERNLQRVKGEFLGMIRQEEGNPNSMARRVLPKLLYGEAHAYGSSFTGSGTAESIQALTRQDVVDFHNTWFKANHAAMVVVGDATVEEIVPSLEKHFASMQQGDIPQKNIAQVPDPDGSTVYIMDRPGAEQSVIFAGRVIEPTRADQETTNIEVMNMVLGGDFNARINMNLREDKGWSYGARQVLQDAVGQRPYYVVAPVQSDKTVEAMSEIRGELTGIIGDKPVTEEELTRVKNSMILTLPGSYETSSAVAGKIVEMIRFDADRSYIDNYAQFVTGASLEDTQQAALQVVKPDNLIWVVVGDRAEVESEIKNLGFGEVVPIDPQGNVID